MANLKTIRRRIGSVRSTQKITRAMKMVAAARLRKAQAAAESFRPYADAMGSMLARVASQVSGPCHPLLERREGSRRLVLVMSSDRGLCGGFNSNLCREVQSQLDGESDLSLAFVGRKACDYFCQREAVVWRDFRNVCENPSYATAAAVARELGAQYADSKVDRIDIAYTQLVSMISQRPIVRQLLPVVLPENEAGEVSAQDYLFEPGQEDILARLLPRYIEVQVYRALLESLAAEHAARMTAMEGATTNAEEMIDHLTLVYNRARQGAITRELIEIVGGAEALNQA
jgi:F-type H+-transporting ATPase subunit gamma